MTFLSDADLLPLLDATPPLVEGLEIQGDPLGDSSPVQPSSVDLSIGDIVVPETHTGKLGSASSPRQRYPLGAGQTAVVVTRQKLHLPSDVAAIGFPPAHVSALGILMTNPGHIDPGYVGRLSFTVINMARETYTLERGSSIVTLLFTRLAMPAERDWSERHSSPSTDGVSEETLEALSRDFLDVERRADAAVKHAAVRATAIVTVLVAVLGALASVWSGGLATKDTVNELETKVAVLQEKLSERDAAANAPPPDRRTPGT